MGATLFNGVADYSCSGYTYEYNVIKDGVTNFSAAQEDKDRYLDHLKDGKKWLCKEKSNGWFRVFSIYHWCNFRNTSLFRK